MGAVNYRATIDGGIRISNGIITTIAVDILPTIRKGRRVYVRAVADTTICVELQMQQPGELAITATRWGDVVELPSWAQSLRNLLTI